METQSMRAKLVRHGDDLALVLDQSLLDQLNIGSDTMLDISIDGQVLVITPAEDEARSVAFEESLKEMDRQYSDVFKRLAE